MNSIYARIDERTKKRTRSVKDLYIHGSLERLKKFPLSDLTFFGRIQWAVTMFYKYNRLPYSTITLLSEQLLGAPKDNAGQEYHLDTFSRFATVIIYLTKGKSTKFAPYSYCDLSVDDPPEHELYPSDWENISPLMWNVGIGDIAIFWSNFPHAAPPNSANGIHWKYYAAFTNTPLSADAITYVYNTQLERPVFLRHYKKYLSSHGQEGAPERKAPF